MIEMIIMLAETYVTIGLVFVMLYMAYVGKLISEKYECGMMEGIARFEKAGSTISNIKAVLYCIMIWPKMYISMRNGTWDKILTDMVNDCEYVYDDD